MSRSLINPRQGLNRADCTYSSNGDTNGVFYAIGSTFGGRTWLNPMTKGSLVVNGYDNALAVTVGSGAVDRDATVDLGITTNAAGNFWKCTLPQGFLLLINKNTIQCRPNASGLGSNVASYKLEGSIDGFLWVTIQTISGLTYVAASDWKATTITGATTPYRYFRMLWQSNETGSNSFFFLTNWEIYGTLWYPPSW